MNDTEMIDKLVNMVCRLKSGDMDMVKWSAVLRDADALLETVAATRDPMFIVEDDGDRADRAHDEWRDRQMERG